MDGFEERRAAARRHTGFFTSEEIMALDPKHIPDVFRSVPGATILPASTHISGDLLTLDGDPGRPRRCLPNRKAPKARVSPTRGSACSEDSPLLQGCCC